MILYCIYFVGDIWFLIAVFITVYAIYSNTAASDKSVIL